MDQAKGSEMITLWEYLWHAAESSRQAEEARGRWLPFRGTRLAILPPGTSPRHHPASPPSLRRQLGVREAGIPLPPHYLSRGERSSMSPPPLPAPVSEKLEYVLPSLLVPIPKGFKVEPPLLPVPKGFKFESPLLPVPEGFEDEPAFLPVPEGFEEEPPLLPVPAPLLVPDSGKLGDKPPSLLVPVLDGFGEGAEDRLPSSPEHQGLPRWPPDWDLRRSSAQLSWPPDLQALWGWLQDELLREYVRLYHQTSELLLPSWWIRRRRLPGPLPSSLASKSPSLLSSSAS
ncbi:hypothetical protein CRENBAI_025934 [Crenichthys baileyi]|uniref:Uncharacterized protein n=1 Tax=Crenichthys baileyi TaxID=28760 RepID=A0AAV9RHE4_9TELE